MAGLNDLVTEKNSLQPSKLGDSIGGSSNKELMASARMALSGNWGMSIAGYILYTVLIMSFFLLIFSSAFFTGISDGLTGPNPEAAFGAIQLLIQITQVVLAGAITVGFCSFFLGIAQDGQAQLECLFTGFQRFFTSFATYFMSSLFILLWSLLLIIPGIIAAFRYAMVYYIIADDEDCGPFEAISRSKAMMTGNKWKFFCLSWRFFWWGLLCGLLPIGYLWLVPYMQTSYAKFYEDVK